MAMRLDKYISQCTGLSRKGVRIALYGKRVQVDGVTTKSVSQALTGNEQVTLDGERLALPRARYLMLHKPAGTLSATQDSSQPCVLDLLPPALADGLQIVGRLDKDTTGLLLLTDDGAWNHRITSPRRACAKVYDVTTADPIAPDVATQFADGILLNNESKPTLPATLEQLDERRARVTLQEGRYHQVKRMFAATGNRVVELHRLAVGGIVLDPELAPGDFRPLTEDEIARV
jgi:16S rRNA pseudouridine516 synthase